MKFKKEDLLEGRFNTIERKITSIGRWSTHYRDIFEHEGKFYETKFSRGSTEQQDESPYQYDPDEIECKEVFPIEKTIIVYQ